MEPANLCFSGEEHVARDGDSEPVADLGGDGLEFGTGSETGREVPQEPVAAVEVGTVFNEHNALDVARSIARDVEVEVCEIVEINIVDINLGYLCI